LRKALIREDFPTLDLPRKAISGSLGGGKFSSSYTLFTNWIFLNIGGVGILGFKKGEEQGLVSRVLLSWGIIPQDGGYLSKEEGYPSSQAAYPGASGGAPLAHPCLALLRVGVTVPLPVTRECGGLLPHLFTLARTRGKIPSGRWRSVFCGPVQGLPPPGVTRHPPLWSPDFPP